MPINITGAVEQVMRAKIASEIGRASIASEKASGAQEKASAAAEKTSAAQAKTAEAQAKTAEVQKKTAASQGRTLNSQSRQFNSSMKAMRDLLEKYADKVNQLQVAKNLTENGPNWGGGGWQDAYLKTMSDANGWSFVNGGAGGSATPTTPEGGTK